MTETVTAGSAAIIDRAFDDRESLSPKSTPAPIREAVRSTLDGLDRGELRVAESTADGWIVNEWIKKAVLLYFRINESAVIEGSTQNYYDKVPLKYANFSAADFSAAGVRVVPPATVRYGAHVEPNVVLMPSYVNVGARIGSGTLIDTWATVGSCVQVGRNVHVSGGAGLGGVLEPVQARPTIIEDDCFIGARSEIVEGVVVERGAVISMGVYIGQSTRIYDREHDTVSYGRIPPGAVVVPGSLPSADGRCQLACAVIVKRVDEKTRAKVGINALLREVE